MIFLNLKKKNIFLKLDNYRKTIRIIKLMDFYKNKILLVCYSIFFNGYVLNLLKDFFSSQYYKTYNYKDNFKFLILSSKNKNYLYNYKFYNNLVKHIIFSFNNFNEIYLFLYRIVNLTLSPYLFYPLYFITSSKNILISFNLFSFYFKNYKYKYNKNSFFYYIYINIIKKAIFIIFIFIIFKIDNEKKYKLCQH
jgi:hypothetical protein